MNSVSVFMLCVGKVCGVIVDVGVVIEESLSQHVVRLFGAFDFSVHLHTAYSVH